MLLLAADLVDEADVRASLELAARRTSPTSRRGSTSPRRPREGSRTARKYLMMGHRLSRRLLDVHLEWLDEIERELES